MSTFSDWANNLFGHQSFFEWSPAVPETDCTFIDDDGDEITNMYHCQSCDLGGEDTCCTCGKSFDIIVVYETEKKQEIEA